jgi:hypothetical protein
MRPVHKYCFRLPLDCLFAAAREPLAAANFGEEEPSTSLRRQSAIPTGQDHRRGREVSQDMTGVLCRQKGSRDRGQFTPLGAA